MPPRLQSLEDRTVPAGLWWSDLQALPASVSGSAVYLHPDHSRAILVDPAEMRSVLSAAPDEAAVWRGEASGLVVSLPRPDGTVEQFAVVDSPIMEPGLAARFPEIRTYAGVGLDDPTATVRMDLTPQGFHAQVLSAGGGSWYVDPYYHLENRVHISYFSHDLGADDVYESRGGVVTAGPRTPPPSDGDALAPAGGAAKGKDGGEPGGGPINPLGPVSGATLRTYRAAVAATGEYTAFHGGTVALGQAAIVTAMNRINQIYENELAIRMVLVANNSSLVYTNASTDPYTNNNGSTMLGQNQTTVDSVIGNANYDIGHVFSTGGGGVAYLGSVGVNSIKAGGVTGQSAPVGDPFTVDYVAHEMGHQFGAEHTFNTPSAGGNRNASTAYEPGSGSTIMAYAGITGADSDLQPNSDPYFHSVSLEEILAHVDGTIPTVGTRTSTGNTAPAVNAGADYTIPTGTPFVLTASGSDANGDTLTYDWEERDLGPATLLSTADNGSSPLFRSWSPTTDPSRTFPRLSNLVNNTLPVGEKLYAVARTSNWRVTVRDNRAGGGGINGDDMVLTVVNTGAPFAVTSPNTAVTWAGATTQTVTWNVAGTTGSGINTANVRIRLSTDGGLTYPTTVLAATPNDGSETITVPNVGTTQARIRVEAVGNVFFDISNANFTITQTTGPVVTDVTSSVANGTYAAGAVIPVQVAFNTAVTVTGTPTLALNPFGTPAGVATYASGSGTNTLTFNYTVASGQWSADLDYASTTALSLNGGTITGSGGATNLTLPVPGAAGSLGANKNIAIDAAGPPQVTGRVFEDWNGNGAFNMNDPAVAGQVVFLDADASGTLNGAERSAVTAADGTYAFYAVANGNYSVRTVVPSGWTLSAPAGGGHAVAVSSPTDQFTGRDFGQGKNNRVYGYAWNDADGDGVVDAGETPAPGRTVYLDLNNSDTLDTTPPVFTFNNNTPTALPDLATTTSKITTAGLSGPITDVNVRVNITHPYDADLDVFLIGPDGTRVELFTDVGSSGDNFTNTVLDDEATTSITAGSPPFTGTYRPEGLLSAFDGKSGTAANGTWTLEITDDAGDDIGTLNNWSLTITASAEPSATTAANGNVSFDLGGASAVRMITTGGETLSAPVGGEYAVTPAGAPFFDRRFGLAPAVPPPALTGVTVNATGNAPSATSTYSRITQLVVTFNTPIVSLNPGAFTLSRSGTNLTSGGSGAISVAGLGTNTLTLTFTAAAGVESGSLADGIWTLRTDFRRVYNAAGNASASLITTNNIRRLFGDGDGNGTVNLVDFGLFGGTFGRGSAAAGFNPAFDWNGDGVIDLIDFGAFGQRFGKGL